MALAVGQQEFANRALRAFVSNRGPSELIRVESLTISSSEPLLADDNAPGLGDEFGSADDTELEGANSASDIGFI